MSSVRWLRGTSERRHDGIDDGDAGWHGAVRWYRALWWSIFWLFGVLGLVVALVALPVALLGPLLVVVATTGGCGYVAVRQRQAARVGLRGVLGCGAGCALAVLVLFGLGRVLGVSSVALVLLMAGSHPGLLGHGQPRGASSGGLAVRRRDGPTGGPSAAAPRVVGQPDGAADRYPPTPEQALRAMSTIELCRQWQRSYTALQQLSDPAMHAHLAQLRSGYLQELERRDPAGFDRWIATGARAGSDPGKYLAGGPDPTRLPRPGQPG